MLKEKEILKDRVEAKRKELEARLSELKADTREGSSEKIKEVREALDDLGAAAKEGWDNLSELAAKRINEILGR